MARRRIGLISGAGDESFETPSSLRRTPKCANKSGTELPLAPEAIPDPGSHAAAMLLLADLCGWWRARAEALEWQTWLR